MLVLLFGVLSLLVSQLDLPPELDELVGMWRRAMVLLVVSLVVYSIVTSQLAMHKDRTEELAVELKVKDLDKAKKLEKEKDAWENASSHPSAFLTTRDGKPRLFPFPLGKTNGLKGELWWEAGNTPHV